MRVKPSRQQGQGVFDINAGDTPMRANRKRVPDFVSSIAEEESAYRAQLDERANRRTRLLEEILSRSQLLASLEMQKH